MHVLVVTCAHRGDDARIVHRQARSLLEAGHRVTLISASPPSTIDDPAGLVRVPIPRAIGRRRVKAWRATRQAVRSRWRDADIVLLHDPELVPLLARRWLDRPVVWDVHEDYIASVSDRSWIPGPLRGIATGAARKIERRAARRCHLILAEDSYAHRLGDHPVVPNSTWIQPLPDPQIIDHPPRVVYIGRLSVGRGAHELIELGQRLRGRVTVELIGDADADVRDAVQSAHTEGDVVWRGFMPNPIALQHLSGALAGLSLLHDEPNYVHSRPTKLIEYAAHGVPFISTPLPLAVDMAERSGGGAITEGDTVSSAVATVERWLANPHQRNTAAVAAHAYVSGYFSWQRDGEAFVARLQQWSSSHARS